MLVADIDALAALGNAAAAVGYPFASLAVDRAGVGFAFALGCLLSVGGCAMRLLGTWRRARSFCLFAAGQFLANVGSTFLNVLPAPLAVRRFPRRAQGVAACLGQFGVAGGGYAGPLLGVAFRTSPVGLLQCQLVATLAVLPLLMVTCERFAETAVAASVASVCDQPRWGRIRSLWQPCKEVWCIPGMPHVFLGYSLTNSAFSAFCSALEQLGQAMPGGTNLNQLLAIILVVGVVAGTAMAGPACDRLGAQPALATSGAAAAAGWLGCLLSWVWPSPTAAAMCWAVVVVFAGGAIPTLSSVAASQAAPHQEGTACAQLNFLAAVGAMLLQLTTGWLLGAPGDHAALADWLLLLWTAEALVAALMFLRATRLLPTSGSNVLFGA